MTLLSIRSACCAALILRLASPAVADDERPPSFDAWFADEAAESGVALVNVSGSQEKKTIVESTGSGACFLDYDLDSDLDLYLVNGATLQTMHGENAAHNVLYENQGNGRFTDVTAKARIGHPGWGGGCAVGDYDNDGDPDLYITNYGRNVLYRNEGSGTFTEVTPEAGVDDDRWSTGATFVDVDGDGWLDLYVVNYLRFGTAELAELPSGCSWKGAAVMCGPRGFEAQADALFRNLGDGTFKEISAGAGIATRPLYGLGVVAGDVDADGDQDLFVANDSQENQLYINDGRGVFTDQALVAGVALSADGRAQAGMGTSLGDFDNDGDEDLFVTNFSDDYHTLYRNDGDGLFSDVSLLTGLDPLTRSSLGWGSGFFDFDNDGYQDLVIVGGHVYPQVDAVDPSTTYRQRNLLLRNVGGTRFADVTAEVGPGFAQVRSSRGLAVADFDDDGDLDLIVVNENDTPSLLRNHGRGVHHWLKVRLIGQKSNRDGLGTRLQIEAGGRRQLREMRLSSGYYSSHDPRVHFGLGSARTVERLLISWPSGKRQVLEDLTSDRLLTIDEEKGLISSVGLSGTSRRARSSVEPVADGTAREDQTLSLFPTGSDQRLTPSLLAQIDGLAQGGTRAIMGGDHAAGITAYTQALTLLPSWEAAAQSTDALGFGDPRRYRRFLAALYDNLGVALMRAERLAECPIAIEKAIAIEPDRAKYLHNLGLCHYHARRYPAAVDVLERALEAAPQRGGLRYDLGRSLALAGHCPRAIEVLGQAIDEMSGVDPRGLEAESWYQLGGCQEAVGDLEAATVAYRETLTRVPGDQAALFKLQSVWRRLARPQAAEHAYALFRQRQPVEEALRSLRRSGPRSPEEQMRLTRTMLAAGLAPDAVREARTALVSSQGARAALLLLAKASLALRPPDLASAEKALRKVLTATATDPDALAGLGHVLLQSSQIEEAEHLFHQALALRSAHPEAVLGIGLLQIERDPGAAAATLGQLAMKRQDDSRILVALARAHLQRGDVAASLAALDRLGGLYGKGEAVRIQALALTERAAAQAWLESSPFLGREERGRLAVLIKD